MYCTSIKVGDLWETHLKRIVKTDGAEVETFRLVWRIGPDPVFSCFDRLLNKNALGLFFSCLKKKFISRYWCCQTSQHLTYIFWYFWLHAWKKKKNLQPVLVQMVQVILAFCFDLCAAADGASISTLANTKSTCSFSQPEHQIIVLSAAWQHIWNNSSHPDAIRTAHPAHRPNENKPSDVIPAWLCVFFNCGLLMDGALWGWSHTSHSERARVSLPTFGREWG